MIEMVRKKGKKVPKTHKFKIGDVVKFRHAGSTRTGKVIELTKESDQHATYTVTTSADGIIYPCLGVDGSKPVGNIITNDKKI